MVSLYEVMNKQQTIPDTLRSWSDNPRYLPPTKEEVYVFARMPELVCLSVRKITQKRVLGFG